MLQMKSMMWMFIALMNHILFFLLMILLNSAPKSINMNFKPNMKQSKWKWLW